MKTTLLLCLCVQVASNDVWMAVYSTEECLSSALLSNAVVADGECVTGRLSDGTTASAQFTCRGNTEASPWSAGVYLGGSCSGLKIMTLSAEDACTCGSAAVFGYAISAYASCGGTAPDCFLNPGEQRVWGAVYTVPNCDSQGLVADGTVPSADCTGGSLPDGTVVSMKYVCHGHTAESAWAASVYLTGDCTGFPVLNLGAKDACSCASTSVYGYADVSAYVSCDGVRPACFEKYPTDDKYDDVSDSPVTVAVYSATSCADSAVITLQETTNGQSGCVEIATSLGGIGMVVYCDVATDVYTYRAEMFANVDCSGEPFTYAVGDAGTCNDIVTAASFRVDCGAGDASTRGQEGRGVWSRSGTKSALLAVGISVLVVTCGALVYKLCGSRCGMSMSVRQASSESLASKAQEYGTVNDENEGL